MNKDILKGRWNELKGQIKQHWGELTDDEITTIEGRFEKLSGLLQKHYGYNQDKAEKAIDEFVKEQDRSKH